MEILEYLMRELKKKKIEEAVLSFSKNQSRQIKFVDNKIVKTGVEELKDIGVYAVRDKKIITTNFKEVMGEPGGGREEVTLVNKRRVENFVRRLVNFMKTVEEKQDYFGINNKKFKYREVEGIYDSRVGEVDDVDLVEAGINAALKEGAKRTNGILEVHVTKHKILSSYGVEFSEGRSELYFSIRSLFGKEESGHKNVVGTRVRGFDVEEAGRKSGEIARDAKNPIKGRRGSYDVIFAPLAFAPLLNDIGEAAGIFSVEAGMSFFVDKLNKEIGSEKMTIYDDGRLKEGIGSTRADAEGVPTQKTVLIDKGVYRNYLYNTNTARKYKIESTGNAGLISPDPWNVVVKPGEESLNSMIKQIKKGIYMTNVWYTRFSDYHAGDFSTIPRDGCFLIKNGKIIKSLKGIRLSENILNILKEVEGVGKKAEHLRSWEALIPVVCPHVLVKGCNITTPVG